MVYFSCTQCLVPEGLQLLVRTADKRRGLKAQPLFQQRGIDSAEIERMLQVLAIELLCWVQGRVLGIQPAGHTRANDESAATRAVIRTTAVILDAPSKLGEHQDDDLICGIVLFQILHKGMESTGEFPYQAWMCWDLAGMRVIATMLSVEDARAQFG